MHQLALSLGRCWELGTCSLLRGCLPHQPGPLGASWERAVLLLQASPWLCTSSLVPGTHAACPHLWDVLSLEVPSTHWSPFLMWQLTRPALPWVVASMNTLQLTSLSVFRGSLLPISGLHACCFSCLNPPLCLPAVLQVSNAASSDASHPGRGCSQYRFLIACCSSLDRMYSVQND